MKKILTAVFAITILIISRLIYAAPSACYSQYQGVNCGSGMNIMYGGGCASDAKKAAWDAYCSGLTHGIGVYCLGTLASDPDNKPSACVCSAGYAYNTADWDCSLCADGYVKLNNRCMRDTSVIFDDDKDTIVAAEWNNDEDIIRIFNAGDEQYNITDSQLFSIDEIFDITTKRSTAGAGYKVVIHGGDAAGAGNNSGGIVQLYGGGAAGTGSSGYVHIGPGGSSPSLPKDKASLYIEGAAEIDDTIYISDGTSADGAITFTDDLLWDMYRHTDTYDASIWSWAYDRVKQFVISPSKRVRAHKYSAIMGAGAIEGRISDINNYTSIKSGNEFAILDEADLLSAYNGPVEGFGFTGIVKEPSSAFSAVSVIESPFTGSTETDYVIEVQSAGPPFTYRWSDTGGASWNETGRVCGGGIKTLSNNVRIYFNDCASSNAGDKFSFSFVEADKMFLVNAMGGVISGKDADRNMFDAYSLFTRNSTDLNDAVPSSVVIENASDGTKNARALLAVGKTKGNAYGDAIFGLAKVSAGSDTADATAIRGTSMDDHLGGVNIAFKAYADNGRKNYSFLGLSGDIKNNDKMYIGSSVLTTDYPRAKVIVSEDNVGQVLNYEAGIIAESASNSSYDAYGIIGVGKGGSLSSGIGVGGLGKPSSSSSTETTIGVTGIAVDEHSGGWNIGIASHADNGLENYSFYGVSGKLYNADVIISAKSVRVGNDTAACSSSIAGALRYREVSNASYAEMCMKTGAASYAWVVLQSNTW